MRIVLLLMIVSFSALAQTDKLVDPRDGKEYKVVQIGTQVWMAENMSYKIKFKETYNTKIKNDYDNFYCYDFEDSSCLKYGALYDWDAAQKVCPVGWHLPSKEEYDILTNTVGEGEKDIAFKSLIQGGSFGFEGLFAGYYGEKFLGMGLQGIFWTSTESPYNGAIPFTLSKYFNVAMTSVTPKKTEGTIKKYYLSVRCIKDTTP